MRDVMPVHKGFATLLVLLIAGLILGNLSVQGASPDGKTIVFAVPRTVDRLMPWAAGNSLNSAVISHIHENLVHRDGAGKIVPQLATSWVASPDAKVWTFTLRTGVRFTDGTPLTARNVKEAYEWGRDPARALHFRSLQSLLDIVAEIDAPDSQTLRFRLKQPHSGFPLIMAGQYTEVVSIGAIRRYGLDGIFAHPIGTGPFTLKQWDPGSQIIMTRNRNYWGAAPRIDTIIFKEVPEEGARAIGLQTGEIDIAYEVAPATAAQLFRDPNLTVNAGPSWSVVFISMNTLKPPFSDPRVRQAVSLGIDRLSIVNGLLRGFARVADAPVAPSVFGYCPQKKIEYRPDRARALLTEAGYPNGIDVPFVVQSRFLDIAQAVSAQLERAGIRARMDVMETARFVAVRNVPAAQAPARLLTGIFSSFAGGMDDVLKAVYVKDAWGPVGFNFSYYASPEIERLLEQAVRTVDAKKQKDLYCEMNRLLWRDSPHAWLFYPPQIAVWNKRLKGVESPATLEVNVRNAYWDR
jgi:glutathione transport system substrate-binding protein